MALLDLIGSSERLALVGLAKNTGKTVTLGAILSELATAGRPVGVTSVGRDGEDRDVIDVRIEKPRVCLPAGGLVATTDSLLRASGLAHELLMETDVRTPLGRVLIARLLAAGAIEVAGPSGAQDVGLVSDVMLEHGAEQVLIDGAIDRRAASSPAVANGLIVSTGAILHEDIDQVVAITRDAVELVRLPVVVEPSVLSVAASATASALVDKQGGVEALPARFALSASAEEVSSLLRSRHAARHLIVSGALCEPFLEHILGALRGAELEVVVEDSTRVFLSRRSPRWYERQGVYVRVLHPIALRAITVNPLAPGAHRFDSGQLRGLIAEAIPDVPVLDVLDQGSLAAAAR
jgi:hypothetical protein